VAAPVAASLVSLPTAILRPEFTGVASLQDLVGSLASFAIGDIVGVLLISPPLLWLIDRTSRQASLLNLPGPSATIEVTLVLALTVGLDVLLAELDLGTPGALLLLGVAWIGLRFGRAAAWAAMLVAAVTILPRTALPLAVDDRLAIHMSLTAILMVGYLAGSFADAQARARAELQRRDRLLFQAERLKTLRAMSVAVIHEISQPLSTLAIEARHLRQITTNGEVAVAEGAALIDRKATALSELVRRLRRFGGRTVDEPSPLPLTALMETVQSISISEARAAGVTLTIEVLHSDAVVLGQEVELTQAVLNLVRNAIQGTADGRVRIDAYSAGREALIKVVNSCKVAAAAYPGMGIGTLVSRAIVEAHGGRLDRVETGTGETHAIISLPRLEDAHV
jgi:two-component system sensor kinase FixL